ncbi:MAG: hypothetical protein ACYDCP_07110 [Thermoplasmataceae archaeon]
MAALVAPLAHSQVGYEATPLKYEFPIAANAQLIPGGLAMLVGGYVQEAAAGAAGTSGGDNPIVGVVSSPSHMDELDNLTGNPFGNSGLAGARIIEITQGVFDFASGAGADAITAANAGLPCYAIDDHTVGLTSASGTRPRAGKIVGISAAGKVQVLIGFAGTDPKQGKDVELVATAALAAGQIVALDTAHAGQVVAAALGQVPIGVVQNAPGAGGFAIVRSFGLGIVKTAGAQAVGDLLESAAGGVSKVLVLETVSGADVVGGTLVGQALSAVAAAGLVAVFIDIGGGVPTTAA